MRNLNKDWITEYTLDPEYKKYVLLDYLQSVSDDFSKVCLYPALADIIGHYRYALQLQKEKRQLEEQLHGSITGLDLKSGKVVRDQSHLNHAGIEQLSEILDYSIPMLAKGTGDGKQLYEFVEEHLEWRELGLIPLMKGEGYLLLRSGDHHVDAYRYMMKLFEKADDRWRAVHTTFVNRWKLNISNTWNAIKMELIRCSPELPNPAVYAVETNLSIPIQETLLPVAKRILMRQTA